MTTKVTPSSNELEYSESMFKNGQEQQMDSNIIGVDADTPNDANDANNQTPSNMIPSKFGSHAIVKLLNPSVCGWACEKRTKDKTNKSAATCSFIGIDSLSFQFYDGNSGNSMNGLEQSFRDKFARQHLFSFRTSCYVGCLFMILYAGMDWYYYSEEEHFTILIVLRFAGFIPTLLLSAAITHSKIYWNHRLRNILLSVSTLLLGSLIIAYSYITRGANQGTFSLFFCVLFFLTPLPFGTALGLGSILWAAYLPCLLVSGESQKINQAVDLLLDFDVLQAWSNLFASLILYGALRYVQVKHFATDTVKLAFLARNRNAAHEEREHASQLLLSCLPEEIIGQLEDVTTNTSFAKHHDSVTVLFCQVCNISSISVLLDNALGHQDGPKAVVSYLNPIFTVFDQIMDQCHCYKVETVMDVYMAVAGCPTEVENHADLIAHCACLMIASKIQIKLDIEKSLRKLCSLSPLKSAQWKIDELVEAVCNQFDIHIGINSGKINAGVCGNLTPRYKLFGDTVNTASRMESTAPYGIVQASPAAAALISKDLFVLIEQKSIPVKGKGEITPFYLTSKNKNILTIEPPKPILMFSTNRTNRTNQSSQKETNATTADDDDRYKPKKRKSTSVLRKSVIAKNDGHDNDHFRDFVEEWNNTQNNPPALIPPTLHASQYTWMGYWGNPQMPCASCCFTKSLIRPVVQAYHQEQEKRFENEKSSNQMKILRYLAYLTLFTAAALCWLEFDRYHDYTNDEGGVCYRMTSYGKCVNDEHLSIHADYKKYNLCGWNTENSKCFRNFTIKSDATDSHGCQWVYDIPTSDWFRGRANRQFVYVLLARFAGLGSLSVLLVGLTFVKWFKSNPFGTYQQLLGGTLTMSMGFVIIFMTWLSGVPGQGMLICWLFLAMYASNIRFLLRLSILIVMAVLYAPVMYYYNPYKSTNQLCQNPMSYIGTRMFFILFSTVATALPLAQREIWMRKEFARKEAMEHSEKLLNQLHSKTHDLMSRLLPKHVVLQLSTQQRHERMAIAEFFSEVSIVFTDMKGFTKFSSTVTPSELVGFLNDMYQRFDDISAVEGVYKVEIIGDAYFGVAGCPKPTQQHAEKCARASLAMIDAVEDMKEDSPALKKSNVQIRIGVHSGPVVAGVVGLKDPRYHLFGDTVTYANLMESEGIPGKVQCSDRCANELRNTPSDPDLIFDDDVTWELILRPDEITINGEKRKTWFIKRKNGGRAGVSSKSLSGQITGGASNESYKARSRANSINTKMLAAWDEDEEDGQF